MGPLSQRYLQALEIHLERADESALTLAYEIGRGALKEGYGVLAMATAHHEALSDLAESGIDGPEVERAAELFFVEALAAFEMAHRGFREAAGILNELNDQLEREIRRIAHSLHDDVQQLLAAVSIQIEDVRRDVAEPVAAQLGNALQQLDQAASSVRHLSHELRPTILDDFGLVPALEYLAETFSKGGQLRVTVEGGTLQRLKPAVEIALYRIAQESLTNIVRHARARRARIGVRSTRGNLRLTIRDDGEGFDVEEAMRRGGQRGLGLAGMKKRAEALVGLLQIQSAPGKGTDIVVTIPLSAATGGGHEHAADPSRSRRRPQPGPRVPARPAREGGVRGPRRRG